MTIKYYKLIIALLVVILVSFSIYSYSAPKKQTYSQQDWNNYLWQENENLKFSISSLESKVRNLESEARNLESKVRNLESEASRVNSRVEDLENIIANMKRR